MLLQQKFLLSRGTSDPALVPAHLSWQAAVSLPSLIAKIWDLLLQPGCCHQKHFHLRPQYFHHVSNLYQTYTIPLTLAFSLLHSVWSVAPTSTSSQRKNKAKQNTQKPHSLFFPPHTLFPQNKLQTVLGLLKTQIYFILVNFPEKSFSGGMLVFKSCVRWVQFLSSSVLLVPTSLQSFEKHQSREL